MTLSKLKGTKIAEFAQPANRAKLMKLPKLLTTMAAKLTDHSKLAKICGAKHLCMLSIDD